jgi:hypothetical protein
MLQGGKKTRSELALYVFLVVIGAFVILRTITSLWLPFGWDHGAMAATGHVYLEGGFPTETLGTSRALPRSLASR